MLGRVHQPYRKASVMSHPSTSTRANKRTFALVLAAMIPLAAAGIGGVAAASGSAASGIAANGAGDLGPRSGLLARDHLTVESALQVDLSKQSRPAPAVPGRRRRARRSGSCCSTRPMPAWPTNLGHQLRAQARQHRHRLSRMRRRP